MNARSCPIAGNVHSATVGRRAPGRAPGFHAASRAQRGVALVIALLLLVVITLVGFAAVRGTIVQQKLSSNMYDRQVALQNAEAGLRAAADLIASNPNLIARNCQTSGSVCGSNPFQDPNISASDIHGVKKGTGTGQYSAASVASGQPQYVIEDMGNWNDPTQDTGFNQTANARNAGVQGASITSTYYRITAHSGDPADTATTDNRAIVTLQAIIKRG
jgi:type IV pilus assembly protein PilX